ncbi:MAG TPA: carboxypeptidase-like regulatory domain-containing protein [Vicinamibacterales bacterium]|nr:carboxypeptidase-like regulatory domain-containing protein [Vicinamibacterales bacterium]
MRVADLRLAPPPPASALGTLCVAIVLTAFASAPLLGQTLVGQISGTIKDGSGGVVPGVAVLVVNDDTGGSREAITDGGGFYVVTNLAVGTYTVRAELPGFKRGVKSGNQLVSDGRLTVDFRLEPGAVSETVEVVARTGEGVNTTSGELARVIDREQVENLALNARNYIQLTTLIPGTPLIFFDAIDQTVSNSANQSVNGNRGDANNVMIDGGFNLSKSNNTLQSHNVGLDFIQEVKIQASNFSAEYGRQAGAAVNVVTRGGSNQLRGSLFEFFRDDSMDKTSFFAAEKPKLRVQNYGWTLGGRIRSNKAFFFGGQEWRDIDRTSSPVRRTLPTRAQRRGDFSGTTGNLFFPGTTVPVPNRNISALISPQGRAIAAVYDAMEARAALYVDEPRANNAVYQLPSSYEFRQDILRLDYRIDKRHTVYGRYLHDSALTADPFGSNVTSPLPTVPTERPRPTHSLLVSHNWVVSPKLVNEAKATGTWSDSDIVPTGSHWKRSTFGLDFPRLFDGGRYPEGLPDIAIVGYAGFRGPARANATRSGDFAVTDTATMLLGRHTMKSGVVYIKTTNDQDGRVTDFTLGDISFNASGNVRSTGNALADALVGNFRTYSEMSSPPVTPFRSENYEAFITDTWKVSGRVSLELGARYQYIRPIFTLTDALATFDPLLYDPARAVIVNRDGTVVPGSGDPFNGMIRAGGGSRDGNNPALATVPFGAARTLWAPAHRLAPRASFALTPFRDSRTAIRGGFGVFYDSPRGDITQRASANPPFVHVAQFESGNLADPAGGRAAGAQVLGEIFAIDRRMKPPHTTNFSVSVQHELAGGILAEAAYVGNRGRNLIRRPDINRVPFAVLTADAALPSLQRSSVNSLRPFRGYSTIRHYQSDAISNYHALQLFVARRRGLVTFTGSYTWSTALTNASGPDANPEELDDPQFDYGPATFHRPHIAVATFTARLPWWRDRRGVAPAVLGGWEVSGILRLQAGGFSTVVGNTSIGSRRADYAGGEIALPAGERTVDRWFNTAAFAPAPNDRRGNAGVGTVQGPGLHVWDISLRKRLSVIRSAKLLLQVDFFNAFNRLNLLGLNTNASSLDFGSLTSAAPPRQVQLGMRLTF